MEDASDNNTLRIGVQSTNRESGYGSDPLSTTSRNEAHHASSEGGTATPDETTIDPPELQYSTHVIDEDRTYVLATEQDTSAVSQSQHVQVSNGSSDVQPEQLAQQENDQDKVWYAFQPEVTQETGKGASVLVCGINHGNSSYPHDKIHAVVASQSAVTFLKEIHSRIFWWNMKFGFYLQGCLLKPINHPNLLLWAVSFTEAKDTSHYTIALPMTEDLVMSITSINGLYEHCRKNHCGRYSEEVLEDHEQLLRVNTSHVLRCLLEGLHHLHQQCLVHGSISASNILVKRPDACSNSTHTVFTCDCGPQWEVRIADFDGEHLRYFVQGRSRPATARQVMESSGRDFRRITSINNISSNREPESESSSSDTNDPQYVSPASDMWAFGGVAIHVVMGFLCTRTQYKRNMANEVFCGEKWQDMVRFLDIFINNDVQHVPTAEHLLKEAFIHISP